MITKYPKKKILAADEFRKYKDLLSVVLDDGKLYAISEVHKFIKTYLERKVD